MTKRAVMITFTVDASEYQDTEDSPEGTLDLVIAMLRNEADLPDDCLIQCGGVSRYSGEVQP